MGKLVTVLHVGYSRTQRTELTTMTFMTLCAIWRNSDRPRWSSGAKQNDDRTCSGAGYNYNKKMTRTSSGACLSTCHVMRAPNLTLPSMYSRPATFLAQLPWHCIRFNTIIHCSLARLHGASPYDIRHCLHTREYVRQLGTD